MEKSRGGTKLAPVKTAERLAVIETKLEIQDQKLDRIEHKIDHHIEWEDKKYTEIDNKYARKKEVQEVKEQVKEQFEKRDRSVWRWVQIVAPWALAIILTLLTHARW